MDTIHCKGYRACNLVPFKVHHNQALAQRALQILDRHRSHITWREEQALENLVDMKGGKADRRTAAGLIAEFEHEFRG